MPEEPTNRADERIENQFDLDRRSVTARIPNRYEIISVLGSGGMGHVYKVRDTVLDKVVVVKVINIHKAAEQQIVRFQKEAKAAACLNHENIVSLIDFGIGPDRTPYMVLDYFEGETLREMIEKEGALLVEDAILVFDHIARALVHAHARKIVHRDLKCSNIIITHQGEQTLAKLFDFGIARILSADKGMDVTHTKAIIGTPAYMSPEQARGQDADERSDIYSLGCVMFECLSGRLPFICDNPVELLDMHIKHELPELKKASGQALPYELTEIVLKCLRKEQSERYQSARELLEAIESLSSTEGDAFDEDVDHDRQAKDEGAGRLSGIDIQFPEIDRFGRRIEKPSEKPVLSRHTLAGLVVAALVVFLVLTVLAFSFGGNAIDRNKADLRVGQREDYKSMPSLEGVPDMMRTSKTTIDLTGAKHITKEDLARTAASALVLDGAQVSDGNMSAITELNALESLNMDGTTVTARGIAMLSGCKKLSFIKVGSMHLDRAMLDALGSIKTLRTLELRNCSFVNGADLKGLAALPALEDLCLRNCSITVDSCQAINGIASLRVLTLSDCNLNDELIEKLAENTHIARLNLPHNKALTDRVFAYVRPVQNVKYVDLDHCMQVSDDAVTRMRKERPELVINFLNSECRAQTLEREGNKRLARKTLAFELEPLQPYLSTNDKGQVCLNVKHNLNVNKDDFKAAVSLDIHTAILDSSNIDDDGLIAFSQLKSVNTLSLSDQDVTARGIRALSSMPNLEYITLRRMPIGADELEALSRIEGLHQITFNRCEPVNGPGLAKLVGMKNLVSLSIQSSRIEGDFITPICHMPRIGGLTLEWVGLTDDQAVKLAQMKELVWVNLTGNAALTDQTLKALSKSKSLKVLTINECPKLTPAGLSKFKSATNIEVSARVRGRKPHQ